MDFGPPPGVWSPVAGPAAVASAVAVGGAVAVVAGGGFGAEFAVDFAVVDVAGCPACGAAVAVRFVFGEGVAAAPAACGGVGVGGCDECGGAALVGAGVVGCSHVRLPSGCWPAGTRRASV